MFKNYDNYVRRECKKATIDQLTNGYISVHTQPKAKEAITIKQVSQPITSDLSVMNQVISDPKTLYINHEKTSYDQKIIELNRLKSSNPMSKTTETTLLENELRLQTLKTNQKFIGDTLVQLKKAELERIALDVRRYLSNNINNPSLFSKQADIRAALKPSVSYIKYDKTRLIDYIIQGHSILDEDLTYLANIVNQPVENILLKDKDLYDLLSETITKIEQTQVEGQPEPEKEGEEEIPELEVALD